MGIRDILAHFPAPGSENGFVGSGFVEYMEPHLCTRPHARNPGILHRLRIRSQPVDEIVHFGHARGQMPIPIAENPPPWCVLVEDVKPCIGSRPYGRDSGVLNGLRIDTQPVDEIMGIRDILAHFPVPIPE